MTRMVLVLLLIGWNSFKSITKRSNRNHVITFDSHLKTALNIALFLGLVALRGVAAILFCFLTTKSIDFKFVFFTWVPDLVFTGQAYNPISFDLTVFPEKNSSPCCSALSVFSSYTLFSLSGARCFGFNWRHFKYHLVQPLLDGK